MLIRNCAADLVVQLFVCERLFDFETLVRDGWTVWLVVHEPSVVFQSAKGKKERDPIRHEKV